MNNLRLVEPMPKTLDRAAWHKPLVSIIITHHNYSLHLEDCLRSITDQTHANWECVVVDDASSDEEHDIAKQLVERMGDERFRFLALEENVGQIPAFFAGLDQTRGEFVCPLDPDDRYAETFLAEMVAAHNNVVRHVPLISCEQMLLRGDQLISGVVTGHSFKVVMGDDTGIRVLDDLHYFPATSEKWPWSSTSGMMFRRPALNACRPNGGITWKRQLDAWLAPGAHMLGGSMFLNKRLVYRGVHADNSWIRGDVLGMGQSARMASVGAEIRAEVRGAIIANGYELDLARAKRGKRTMAQRLRRSFAKRLDRFMGLMMEKGDGR